MFYFIQDIIIHSSYAALGIWNIFKSRTQVLLKPNQSSNDEVPAIQYEMSYANYQQRLPTGG
jgi:hypothetical protein